MKTYTFWYTEEVVMKAGFIAENDEQAREYLQKFHDNEVLSDDIPEFWNTVKDNWNRVDFETLEEHEDEQV